MYYPKPSTPTPEGTTIPRTLTPLSRTASPVSSEASPTIDIQSREFSPGWICSTHIFQAASPRESPLAETLNTPNVAPLTGESTKAERQASVDSSYDRIMACRNAIASGEMAPSNNSVLWSVVNRYARTEPLNDANQPSVTLVVAHATGFHKEASFRYLYQYSTRFYFFWLRSGKQPFDMLYLPWNLVRNQILMKYGQLTR